MAQSKLKSFSPVIREGVHSNYTNTYGTFYNFLVEFENGDSGSTSSKSTTPKWKIGDEYTYDVAEVNGYKNIKGMKPVNGFGGGKVDTVGMTVGNAISNAVLLICHGKIDMKDLEKTADRICEIAFTLKTKHT